MNWLSPDWLKALDIKGHQSAAVCLACVTILILARFDLVYLGTFPLWARGVFAAAGIGAFFLWLAKLYIFAHDAWQTRKRQKTIRLVLREAWWHMGSSGGEPAMQIVSRWYVTNVGKPRAMLVKAYLNRGWWHRPQEGSTIPREPIDSGHMREIDADFWVRPPFREKGQAFRASITLVDIFGAKHKTTRVTFPSDWKPKAARNTKEIELPKEPLHLITNPLEKRIVAILKDEVNRYHECGRPQGGLGSVQITYENRTLAGIGYQGREANSPKDQWLVPDPEKAKIHSDNLDQFLELATSQEQAKIERAVNVLTERISRDSEYASIGYFFLLTLYRLGRLETALEVIKEQLKGDRGFGFDDSVRMLSGLLQYEHSKFSDSMLDSAERFAEGLTGYDHLLMNRVIAARARLHVGCD